VVFLPWLLDYVTASSKICTSYEKQELANIYCITVSSKLQTQANW